MSALAASAFATLLAQCAPDAPADYMQRIAVHESAGLQPYAMHDNTTGASVFPGTYDDAVSWARGMLRAGHSIDVGLMAINNRNWRWLGLTVETALDPCQNVRAGAQVLSAMSRYNTGDARRGLTNGYVMKVLAAQPASETAQPNDRPPQSGTTGASEQGDLPTGSETITTTYEGDK